MKKMLMGLLCVTLLLTTSLPVMADDVALLISTQVETQKREVVEKSLKIDDSIIELGNLKIYEVNRQIVVPLKITSENLGFTVTWDGKNRSVHMDNGILKTDVVIGLDNYFASSSQALGMAAPKQFGIAPFIINGRTYVPVSFFEIMLSDENCVTITDDSIEISSNKDGSTQLPNPIKDYVSLEEAKSAVNFAVYVPQTMPSGYTLDSLAVIGSRLFQMTYVYGDNRIVYRTAEGSEDTSGDYNVYKDVNSVDIGTLQVVTKGNDGTISLAIWTKDSLSYSLSFTEGVSVKTLSTIIESIK